MPDDRPQTGPQTGLCRNVAGGALGGFAVSGVLYSIALPILLADPILMALPFFTVPGGAATMALSFGMASNSADFENMRPKPYLSAMAATAAGLTTAFALAISGAVDRAWSDPPAEATHRLELDADRRPAEPRSALGESDPATSYLLFGTPTPDIGP